MKAIGGPSARGRRYFRLVFFVLAAGVVLLLTLLFSVSAWADPDLSDDDLFNLGLNAYEATNCVDAVRYWEAYIQRHPLRLEQDSVHRSEVHAGLDRCVSDLKSAIDNELPKCLASLPKSSSAQSTIGTSGYLLRQPPKVHPLTTSTVPNYPLVCRGGGKGLFYYMPSSSASPKPQVMIKFESAAMAAGSKRENIGNFQPGQCAWMDRVIGSSEANSLVLTEPLLGLKDFEFVWRDNQLVWSPGWLAPMNSSDSYELFQAHNDGKKNLIVTSIQQCLPGPDQAAFFVDWNYKGSCVVKNIGSYDNVDQMGIPNDSLSSLMVGANVKATVCMHGGQTAPCVEFTEDSPNISNQSMGGYSANDQTTSFRVESRILSIKIPFDFKSPIVIPPAIPPVQPAPPSNPASSSSSASSVGVSIASPGVYVLSIRVDPSAPKRGQFVTFWVTFANTTGAPQGLRWRIKIYEIGKQNSFGDTAVLNSTIQPGTSELPSEANWRVAGLGDCMQFVARAVSVDPNTKVETEITPPGGATLSSAPFQVCP
ncbi:MAG: hypothetical protein HZB51_06865 [Chloroflexi bacterium]|nr:hypothetical protein [Chloroflexota bacterium]